MSTSRLQIETSKRLFRKYAQYGIVENIRPDWLRSSKGEHLELDFYIEKLNVAVEVQGQQHFKFTPVFHSTEYDFKEQVRRDEEKRSLCDNAGIVLFYILSRTDIDVIVYEIDKMISLRLSTDENIELKEMMAIAARKKKAPNKAPTYKRKLKLNQSELNRIRRYSTPEHIKKGLSRIAMFCDDNNDLNKISWSIWNLMDKVNLSKYVFDDDDKAILDRAHRLLGYEILTQ